uniref:Uncharacterized protein n=1 Tax=Nelumbo nucifera TaxID=4432 RepID=A0A822Z1F8_NELNU|nr:TPA_asm: hypothetical protein HUJ06_012852 [Nelumbo nucifera]
MHDGISVHISFYFLLSSYWEKKENPDLVPAYFHRLIDVGDKKGDAPLKDKTPLYLLFIIEPFRKCMCLLLYCLVWSLVGD